MADVQLKAVLTAEDKASNVLLNVGKAFAVMGAAALTAAGIFIDKSIKAAERQQVEMAKVDAILRTLSGSFEKNKKATEDAAIAAMKLGFDDESTAYSMAKLLQVTNNQKDAQTALSVAMDIARLKNIDLESATQAVTLAYVGNNRLLKQLGIEVPDNAKKMEVLGLAHDKVAGQAEAFGNTAAGAQDRFRVSMENVQESVGNIILPVLANFFGQLSTFLNSERLSHWIQSIALFFNEYIVPAINANVIPAFNAVKDMFIQHAPFWEGFIKLIGGTVGLTLYGTLVLVTETIKVLVKAFDLVYDAVDGVIKRVKDLIEWFQQIIDTIKFFAKTVSSAPGNLTQNIANAIFSKKASGGSVQSGQPYIVGERGPELFMPSQSGSIVPNNRMGGMVTVNFNNATVRSDNDLSAIISEVKRVLNREQVVAGLRI